MQGELPYSLWKVSSRYFHLNREKEREKQTGAFTDEEYVPAHTHSWSAALWGCVWGNEIVTDKQKVSRFFYYYYYFLHSRDVREFLAVWALKGEKKIQKEKKKKNQTIFTAQSTTEHQLQPSLSRMERAGTGPSIPGIPPHFLTPNAASPKDPLFFPSITSWYPLFSCRHLLN